MNKGVIKSESKRHITTDGLSLADVVKLKKAAFEQERLDVIFDVEHRDLEPDIILPGLKLTTGPLTDSEKESLLNERSAATEAWPEVVNVRGATVEEKAMHLAALKGQFPSHVWRKLLLDLVVDITPLDKRPPSTLIGLLRDALGLPENHMVGSWPVIAGMDDDRGMPKREARECASFIDCNYIDALLTHSDATTRHNAEPMPLNALQRKVKAELGRAPATKTLREWRENFDYWHLTQHHRRAQAGGGSK